MSSVDVASRLGTEPSLGLDDADAADRLERLGPNELTRRPPPTLARRLAAQLRDPLVGLLLVAIVISLVAWMADGDSSVPVEAIVISLIVVANALIGVWQEGRASRAVEALRRLTTTETTVVRSGRTVRVPTTSVVVGDVVLFSEGDVVGVDARVVDASSVEIDEAALTGESTPVEKEAGRCDAETAVGDRSNMVMSGTAVLRGRCRAAVVATGRDTEVGRIAALLDDVEAEPTPLQRQVHALGRTLGLAVIGLALVVVGAIIVTSDVDSFGEAVDALLVAVSLAVAAVPEGLPAIMTVVLALGVQRMSGRNAIVKRLLSVETLGCATVICTDKTGTLTRNEMTVVRLATASGESVVTGVGYSPRGELESEPGVDRLEVAALLNAAAVANDASLGGDEAHGDPTEIALLVAADKLPSTQRERRRRGRVDEVPFDSERKLMSVLVAPDVNGVFEHSGGHLTQYTKGAPDVLLGRCNRERHHDATAELDDDRRADIVAQVDRFAGLGLRTLGVAGRHHRRQPTPFDPSHEHDLEWYGLIGMSDPARAEARDVVTQARRAGIRTVMLTGDHPRTAENVAAAVGLATAGPAVSGAELDAIDWDDVTAVAPLVTSTDVFARVAPEHKLQLVRAMQRSGDVVAMTGDGVNDAPALQRADIGVAMGGIGTDVAREASDMILADDDFATIVSAIEEGREIFSDIRKFLRYLLASNSGEVLVMVIGVLAAGPLGLRLGDGLAVPLLATQILWINLLTDSALALALGVDPSVENVMDQPPRRPSDPIVDRAMWITIVVVGVTTAVAGLVALDLELAGGLLGGDGGITEARTMLFTTVVLAQVFNAFNARSDRVSAFVDLFANRLLWLAVAVTVALQVAVVHVGVLNRAFETTPLSVPQWAICWALASSVLVADEVRKVVGRRYARVRATGPSPLGRTRPIVA